MESYNSTAVFHLPGIFEVSKIYVTLLDIIEKDPSVLKDNVVIGSIYGAPGGIWNGGRLQTDLMYRQEDLKHVRDFMEHHQIPTRFTCTNCLLTEDHVTDAYWNMILDVFNTGHNEIICNSEILENYLRNKYGNNYRYISSTTKTLTDKYDQAREIDKDYFLTVLDYSHNKDIDFLQSIEHKEKCELLCNAVCKPNCPNRLKHYEEISRNQLTYTTSNEYDGCGGGFEWFYQAQKNSCYISPEDINNIYLPMGFKNFKLEGRNANPLDLIEILMAYLVKDSRVLEVRSQLQKAIW